MEVRKIGPENFLQRAEDCDADHRTPYGPGASKTAITMSWVVISKENTDRLDVGDIRSVDAASYSAQDELRMKAMIFNRVVSTPTVSAAFFVLTDRQESEPEIGARDQIGHGHGCDRAADIA